MDHQRGSLETVDTQRLQGFFSFLFQRTQNEIRSNPVVTVDFCQRKHCLIFKAYHAIMQLKSLRLYILFRVALGQTEGCVLYKAESRARDFSPARSFFSPKLVASYPQVTRKLPAS